MTAIGPYVVVFWTPSRLVLVRKGCDAAFLLYSQSNMVEQAVTCSWVPKSPGHHASRRQLSHQGSTRVTGLHPKKVKQASKLYPAGTVTRWLAYAGARDRLFNHVWLGIQLKIDYPTTSGQTTVRRCSDKANVPDKKKLSLTHFQWLLLAARPFYFLLFKIFVFFEWLTTCTVRTLRHVRPKKLLRIIEWSDSWCADNRCSTVKEERCIAAFSDQNQSTQRPKDYNIWANRGHPCFYKNEMALLLTFCIQIPIL